MFFIENIELKLVGLFNFSLSALCNFIFAEVGNLFSRSIGIANNNWKLGPKKVYIKTLNLKKFQRWNSERPDEMFVKKNYVFSQVIFIISRFITECLKTHEES